nr:lexA: repressor [uncultured bacterium]
MPSNPRRSGKLRVEEYWEAERGPRCALPLFVCSVSAGFPSPVEEYIQRKLDLNELLIKHPAATFFVRVRGDSMIGAGIHDGDTLNKYGALGQVHSTLIEHSDERLSRHQ